MSVFTLCRRSANGKIHTKKSVTPPDKHTYIFIIMLLGRFTDENHSLKHIFMSLLHALSKTLI